MPTTIKALYDHGKITPLEKPPVTDTKVEVTVIFPDVLNEDESKLPKEKQKNTFGLSEGKIKIPHDFDEPLEDVSDNAGNSQTSNQAKNEINFGSLKGKITVPDDFDEPLEDLKDYM